MAEFAYLYRGGERPSSPEQSQQIVQKWVACMKELPENGEAAQAQYSSLPFLNSKVRAMRIEIL
jgi:hypothetical protein